ncbi:MAG: tetratricopeptide repeat protein [bacterium]|nr:tetratricopeptide repeat protein [bacterium]
MNLIPWIGVALLMVLAVLFYIYRDRLQREDKRKVPRNHHQVAMEALADSDDTRALSELQKAVQAGQGGVDAYLRLAEIYRGKGQLKKAIHLHRSLAVNKNWSAQVRVRIMRGLAEDYLAAGRWDDALGNLEELRKLTPSDASVLRRISQVYLRKGEGERAQQALKRAHRLEGKPRPDELAILHAEHARHLMGQQRWKEVRKILLLALKLDENCVPALRISSDLNHHEGRDQEAADDLQRLVMTGHPGTELDYPHMEKIFFDMGRFQEIQFVYQEVVTKAPDFWPARFALAEILEKRGRRDEAVRLLEADPDVANDVAMRAAARLLEWGEAAAAGRWLTRWQNGESVKVGRYRCRNCGAEHTRPRWYCSACHAFKSYEPVQENAKSASGV